MEFALNEELRAFQAMAKDFAQQKLAPHAAEWDKDHHFPVNVLRDAANLGMAGITCHEDIGGSDLSRLASALIFEQLATGCISTSAYLSIHNMATSIIDNYASGSLRKKWGAKLTAMHSIASYCLTEPESGSDAASLKTRARKEGDYYIVDGAKAFISGAGVSDVYVCMVRTGDETHQGISCLLIEKGTQGLRFGEPERKMGWCSQPTAMVYFESCRVPVSHLIGQEGEGFKIALSALDGGRVNIGACSLGGALQCLELTRTYLHERKQFGQSLANMQALRFAYANMLTEYEAAKLMVYRAADALDKKEINASVYCAMAKRMATEVAFQISDQAMQLHGGYGYLHDYQIERIFRDLRVHRILEGTNEIMHEIIAKHALNEGYSLG